MAVVLCFGCKQLVSILDHRCPSTEKNSIASLPSESPTSAKERVKPPAANSYSARLRKNKKS